MLKQNTAKDHAADVGSADESREGRNSEDPALSVFVIMISVVLLFVNSVHTDNAWSDGNMHPT